MKIKYLKSSESFIIKSDDFSITLPDYVLISRIRSKHPSLKPITDNFILSTRTLSLAKSQAHRRALNRTDSAWLPLSPKKRKVCEKNIDSDRISFLKNNFKSIALNCLKHDWYYEFVSLCKDTLHLPISQIRSLWRSMKTDPSILDSDPTAIDELLAPYL